MQNESENANHRVVVSGCLVIIIQKTPAKR